MIARSSLLLLLLTCWCCGCKAPAPVSRSVETDFPPSARFGVYSPTATPSITSPEGFTRLLEQRWSLADVRTFCIPERRHNGGYQNLVAMGEVWKGRLYQGMETGFDRIGWYANIKDGHIGEYSLGAERGRSFWLLEIGSPESLRLPPRVAPEPSAPYFIGHK